jgi:predicted NAD/FAD-dependent oxidoreductase
MDNIENSTLHEPILHQKVNLWLQSGYLSLWNRQVSRFDTHARTDTVATLCAAPSMNTWHKKIAGDIKLLTDCKVHALKKTDKHWQLLDKSGHPIATASTVIISTPPEQAFELLKNLDGFSYCQTVSDTSLPQYVCAIGFTQELHINEDVCRGGHSVLASVICENSKPGRVTPEPLREVWTLHSTHAWAQQQSDNEPTKTHQQAAIELTNAFCQHFNIEARAQILTSHYWRLARHQAPQHRNQPFIWNEVLQLGCCGDWLDGCESNSNGIYAALKSSLGLAQKIIQANRSNSA